MKSNIIAIDEEPSQAKEYKKTLMLDHLLVTLYQFNSGRYLASPIEKSELKITDVDDINFLFENVIKNSGASESGSNRYNDEYHDYALSCIEPVIEKFVTKRLKEKYPDFWRVWIDTKATDLQNPHDLCVSFHDARYQLFDHVVLQLNLRDYGVQPKDFIVTNHSDIKYLYERLFGRSCWSANNLPSPQIEYVNINGVSYYYFDFDMSEDWCYEPNSNIYYICQKLFPHELDNILKLWVDENTDLKKKDMNTFIECFTLNLFFPIPEPDCKLKAPYLKLRW